MDQCNTEAIVRQLQERVSALEEKKLTPEELEEIRLTRYNVPVELLHHIAALEAEIARKDAALDDILEYLHPDDEKDLIAIIDAARGVRHE